MNWIQMARYADNEDYSDKKFRIIPLLLALFYDVGM